MTVAIAELPRMRRYRDFPDGTCRATRHAADIAEALILGQPYLMFSEEPDGVSK